MTRGPADPLPAPPPDLAARPLVLRRLSAGSTLFRIHALSRGAIHYSPGRGKPPLGRFDAASGRFGVLYAATDFDGAFAETLLRQPGRSLVSLSEIRARAVSTLTLERETALADLTGAGLSRHGLDARFQSGPFERCGQWADALFDHPARPAGLLYPSRFDPSQGCVALFQRRSTRIRAAEPMPLADMLADVASALDRYGKALDPA